MDATTTDAASESGAPARDAETTLLAEALGVPHDELSLFSREPLGVGTVAGFTFSPHAAEEAGLLTDAVAYVDTSLLAVDTETGLALDGVGRVWIHPSDPHLPALAPAAYSDAAAVLLERLGITAVGLPSIVGYRPGRRAVLRVPTSGEPVWVKVVRPRRIDRVVAAHHALREHGLPVPPVRGWSPAGLLVLDSATGEPAMDAEWQPEPLLDAVDDVRRALAAVPASWPARTSLRERLPWYVERLVAALPDHAEAVRRIAQRIEATTDTGAAASVTIHGDLHLGQLFLSDGRVSGVIDVDTAGLGFAGDDAAAFTGHAVASAFLTAATVGPTASSIVARLSSIASAAHARWGDDPQTQALTAVHLLGHALGAASAGDLDRAHGLIAVAERAVTDHKSPLMASFEAA